MTRGEACPLKTFIFFHILWPFECFIMSPSDGSSLSFSQTVVSWDALDSVKCALLIDVTRQ